MMTSIVRLFSHTLEARTNQNASHTRILLGSKPKYEEYEEEEPKDTYTNKQTNKQTNVSTSLEPEIFFLDLIQH